MTPLNDSESIREILRRMEGKIDAVDAVVRQKQIDDARKHAEQDAELQTLKARMDGTNGKVNAHLDRHWVWLLSTTGLVGAIVSAAVAIAKMGVGAAVVKP